MLAQQRDRSQHELAGVQRALLREQPVVVEVELGELDLAGPASALGVVLGGQRLRPRGVVGGAHELVLEAVDAVDHAREQHRGTPADVVLAQVQVVHPVEQQGEPVGAGDGREERVDAGLGRLRAQQARAELAHAVHGELLVGAIERVLDLAAHRGSRGARRAQREDRLRRGALRDQPLKARDEHRRLAGARAAEHEDRAGAVRDRARLGIGERGHHA